MQTCKCFCFFRRRNEKKPSEQKASKFDTVTSCYNYVIGINKENIFRSKLSSLEYFNNKNNLQNLTFGTETVDFRCVLGWIKHFWVQITVPPNRQNKKKICKKYENDLHFHNFWRAFKFPAHLIPLFRTEKSADYFKPCKSRAYESRSNIFPSYLV